jgi:hypothetical protein
VLSGALVALVALVVVVVVAALVPVGGVGGEGVSGGGDEILRAFVTLGRPNCAAGCGGGVVTLP